MQFYIHGRLFSQKHQENLLKLIIKPPKGFYYPSTPPPRAYFPTAFLHPSMTILLHDNNILHLNMKGGVQHHADNLKRFVVLLSIVEVSIVILYGVFVRLDRPGTTFNSQRYPAYQDVNVMMLIGFGFLMAFSKSFSWSAVSYTFFMNAVMVQLYLLLSAFWKRLLSDGFNSQNYYIYVNQESFTLALYSAASMFISLGVVIGRVGPLETMIMCLVHEVVYTLNEFICLEKIKAFDVGGSMTIHAFGAYSGLVSSLILSSIIKPDSKPGSNYFSNLFGLIGTLFLWMYWPSFNFGAAAPTPFTKTQIITSTILSLTGSCLSTFITSAAVKSKFTMEHILNATLAGGVVIGATAGIILQPGASLAIGGVIGIVSTLGYHSLTPYLEKKFGLFDTCGVHNLHALPGMCGGLISAIAAASFYYPSATDAYPITAVDFPYLNTLTATPYKQGGLQIAATFTSVALGIVTALIGGLFLRFIYSFDQKEFFTDAVYFEEAAEFIEELNLKHHDPSQQYAKVNDRTQTQEIDPQVNVSVDYLKPTV